MDAALVVAGSNREDGDNNSYVALAHQACPTTLYHVADLSTVGRREDAHEGLLPRLKELHSQYELLGFTYRGFPENDCRWMLDGEGEALFAFAEDHELLVSLALPFVSHANVREVSRRHSGLKILIHHQAQLTYEDEPGSLGWREVEQTSHFDNIHLKFSGFYSASKVFYRYPHRDTWDNARRLFELFGPERLHWGSDCPMCLRGVTYQQALQVVNEELDFLDAESRQRILGGSLAEWLKLGTSH